MPCDDVAEIMQISIDAEDRLRSYRLRKQNCGVGVGAESFLLERFQNLSITEILKLQPDFICDENTAKINRFISLKHLFSLKLVLETLIGKSDGGPGNSCRILKINHDSSGITAEAEITVAIITEKIKACDGCGQARAQKAIPFRAKPNK